MSKREKMVLPEQPSISFPLKMLAMAVLRGWSSVALSGQGLVLQNMHDWRVGGQS